MKKIKAGLTLLANLANNFLLIAIFTMAISPLVGSVPALITGGGLFSLNFIPKQSSLPSGYAFFAVQVELWTKNISSNLFIGNEWLNRSVDESEFVLAGTVVHIPQAGATPAVRKNNSTFPVTAVRRTDTDVTYSLDIYTSDPTHIPEAEKIEISYDKITDVLSDHQGVLNDRIADEILINWYPTTSTQILYTTGAASGDALAPSATGTRLAFVKGDLARAQALMNKNKIPKTGRYALVPTDMYTQLKNDTNLLERDNAKELNVAEGEVMKLYGFTIIERPLCAIFNSSNAIKAYGAAAAVGDKLSVLCWHDRAVSKAVGTINFFENKGDATMYGDVYSALVKAGGRRRRSDDKGVVAIVQG